MRGARDDGTVAGSDPGSEGHGHDGEATPPPHLIVNVEPTDATVPDNQMTEPVHARLAARGLLPAEHYVDSGYPSAEPLTLSRSIHDRASRGLDQQPEEPE